MKLKRLVSAALSLTLLCATAVAADMTPPLQTGPSYEIRPARSAPIMIWGSLVLEGDRLVVKNDNEGATDYPEVALTVTDKTYILDAVTGQAKTTTDLKNGETVYAYVSSAMTRSLPPISVAHTIICNLPADFGAPILSEVQQVTTGDGGAVSLLTDRDLILHLSGDTAIIPPPGSDQVTTASGIQPGDLVLAWYQIVAPSLPAQASPTRVMVFPSSYSGQIALAPGSVTLNGAPLTLTPEQAPSVQEGKLLVPLRPIAEALGCTVTWSAEYPEQITVSSGAEVLYTLTLGQECQAVSGVTFVPAEDVLGLHNLKLISA